MRHLFQPRVLLSASLAAALSALACYPRLALWEARPAPVWYLEAVVFLCSITLWGFVFAWHTPYTGRPVLVLKPELKPFLAVTLLGLLLAGVVHGGADPALRAILPEEYPADLLHWLANVLFALGLTQLFLICAPFAWLLRLCQNRWAAAGLTALFSAGVLALKLSALPTPVPALLFTGLLVGRFVLGLLAVGVYWQGGVLLLGWWTLLLEARHWLDFIDQPGT